MNKKTTAKALLATMGLTVLMPAASALAATDINGHWCENIIEKWEKNNLIAGYEDGTFRPDQPITRAEFVSLVNRYLGYTAAKTISFSDVSAGDWYANQVAIAVNAGYVGGFEDNTFRPGDNITRAQTASIIARLTGLSNNAAESYKFADAHRNPEWAKGAIGAVAAKGYMIGDEKNNFDAPDPLTRAEAVAILDRLKFLLDSEIEVVPFITANTTTKSTAKETVITTIADTKFGELVIETTVNGSGDDIISGTDAVTKIVKIPDNVAITKVTLPKNAKIEAGSYEIDLKKDITKTGEYTFKIKDILAAIEKDSDAYAALERLADLKEQGVNTDLITCDQTVADKLTWKIEIMTAEQQVEVFKQLVVTLEKK